MATPDDIETDLTLELDGMGVSPERFQKAVRAFFGVVSEVTKSVCEGRSAVHWQVKVKTGSNLIGVVPNPGFRPEMIGMIANAVHDGIKALENSNAPPRFFNESAVRHVRDLTEVAALDSKDDVRVRLWADRRPLSMTTQTALGTEGFLAEHYEDHGSIDGRLQTVSERGGMRFMVYDTLTDKGVTCYIEADKIDEAILHFRKRVDVYGVIKYRKDGTPLSIRVDDIVPFADASSIPDFRSVHGILRRT